MTEKIEVRYSFTALTSRVPVRHMYIVYTDSNGNQFAARGGPGYFGPGAPEGRSQISASPLGNVITTYGPYNPSFPDWDYQLGDPSELISQGPDLSGYWELIKNAMDSFESEKHPYGYYNSNTAVNEALRRAGLSEPQNDDFGENYAPGHDPWSSGQLVPGDANANGIPDIHESIKKNFAIAKIARQPSPIILDLDGDGVETTKEGSGAFFDHDANGFAESTGWVGADDGLLVRDIDSNGRIDSGRELFGSETLLSSGAKAANGFEALTELDSNHDGQISSGDAAYSTLKIWKDLNGDGYTSAGELLTLAEAGVQSINVGYTTSTEVDPNGNEHRQVGSYTKTDGSTATASDVWFQVDRSNTIAEEWLNVSADIEALPDLQGWGNVYDLHQAMVRDTSGTLKGLVAQFSTATTTSQRESLVQFILYKWTGADAVDPASRGGIFDGQSLAVLEAFMGESYVGVYGSDPSIYAVDSLQAAYSDLFENAFAQLSIQTNLKPYFDKISYSWDGASQKVTSNYEAVATEISTLMDSNNVAGADLLTEVSRALHGVTGKGLVVGTAMDDVWGESTAEDSTVFGMGGNDTIYSSSGDTSSFGGDGNDTITDSYGSDTIEGGNGDDVIVDQNAGDNILRGGNGNDVITFSYYANNLIEGGNGNDLITVDYPYNGAVGFANTVVGGLGNDSVQSGGSADTYIFNRGDGQDTINDSDGYYTGAIDKLVFGDGITADNLSVSRSHDDLVVKINDPNNPVATDQITIGNWFSLGVYQVEIFTFADGTSFSKEQLTTMGNVLVGTDGDDVLAGWVEDGVILGRGGNDTITDDSGSDAIDGGAGNDVIVDGGSGNNVLKGGDGNDTVTFSFCANNTIEGGSGNDLIKADYSYWSTSEYANIFVGGSGNDRIESGGSTDTYIFNRGDGQDVISDFDSYNTGAIDKLVFGAGIVPGNLVVSHMGDHLLIRVIDPENPVIMDQITIENWDFEYLRIEQITFADGVVWDSAIINASIVLATPYADIYRGSGDADIYDGMAGDDQIYGFGGNDNLSGGAGNDLIDGGSGDDVMSGGMGDDVYAVDSTSDIVTELPGDGMDTVMSSINSIQLAANVENLTILNNGYAYNGTGNELNNLIIGNMYDNILDGAQGEDQLVGSAGNDTYVVDSAGDLIVENPEEGIDAVQSSVAYTLGENIESLTLTGVADISGTGNGLDNSLVGNDGNNILNGGAGNDVLDGLGGGDTLAGGTGDDTYVVGEADDVVIENADEGVDTVQSSIAYTLGANLENLTLTGADVISGIGNNLDNVLLGNGADNVLNGGAGNDTLDGGYGNDALIGGVGNDTYYVDATADTITENANEGTDTVKSSITYTLGTNLERLELLELGGAINGTGNGLNNALVGNSSNNTLNGAAGADAMSGGVGNDIYVVDNVGDIVIEGLGEGTDTVQSSQTYTLNANVEKLTLTGSSAISGYGNALDNTLTGNSGANVLTGGLGNDTYVIGATDTVVENAAEGVDVVQAAFSYTLTANTENLTLTGTAAINGTGNALGNNLTGNSASNTLTGLDGNDWLDGKAGADTMVGGLGDDTYVVDNIGDVVAETSGDAADTVNSSITYTLGNYIENLTLTGSAAINGTGNASDNMLTGNTGANILTGGAGNDILSGGAGADTLIGGVGDDIYMVDNAGDVVTESIGEGADTVRSSISFILGSNVENLSLTGATAINGTGNILDNLLIGNAAINTLNGSSGNDILQGMAGNDILTDTAGNNLFDGGAGTDTITGNTGSELFVGGLGNDTITTNTGFDVIAFNKGDGADILNASTGADNTISLGGGVTYTDLALSKSGTDLILKAGTTDQITIKGWYAATTNHSVLNLQVIADAMADFAPGGSDVLKDNKVETFNFAGLVGAFDTALAANPTMTSWSMTNALLNFHLGSGSDSAAIGGDLAYQYGKAGTLAGIGLNAAQSVISSAQFGQSAQTLNAPASWQAETVKLG